MSFLHNHSCECVKSELDLFALPSTQTSIESGQWVTYNPIASLTDDGPIEFLIPGSGDDYIDLSHTLLLVKVRITNEDGTAVPETTKVSPVNNWLHSLFSQLDIYLNQKLVSPPNNTYAYRAYIETLLNYGGDAKETHLQCGYWYKDTHHRMDACDDTNEGFKTRAQLTSGGGEIEMIGHLHGDIFNQEKFLINGVEMRVKLVRTKEAFNLMTSATDTKFKVKFNSASLLVRKIRINPSILLAHQKVLATTTAKYPISRAEVKVITIPTGVQGKTLDNVFLGQIPKRCIIGFVNNSAFNGALNKNPFNFEHHNINLFSIYVDGQQIPPCSLQTAFVGENQIFTSAYNTLFSGTGIHFMNEGHGVTKLDYTGGYCLMAFDMTPDLSASSQSHWNLIRHGSVRIEVRFDTPLASTVNCIVYAEFDNIIEINKNRDISIDYNS